MGRTCGEPDGIGLTAMGVELNGSWRVQVCGPRPAPGPDEPLAHAAEPQRLCDGERLGKRQKHVRRAHGGAIAPSRRCRGRTPSLLCRMCRLYHPRRPSRGRTLSHLQPGRTPTPRGRGGRGRRRWCGVGRGRGRGGRQCVSCRLCVIGRVGAQPVPPLLPTGVLVDLSAGKRRWSFPRGYFS